MPTIARRRARPHVCLALMILLAACNGSSNSFPNDPVPSDPQTGTSTPNTEPPATIPEPPPTTPPTGPDTEAPHVEMLLPAQNDSLTGTAPIMADATDNVGVSSVQFLVDDKLLGAPDTVRPFWLQFDTSYLSDGSHAFSARASDAAGNMATATPRTVSVSNSCKTASPALTPWQNTSFTVSGASFSIRWDATPLEAGLNAVVGLSHNNATAFTSLATAVRFNSANTIDVRNGGSYAAAVSIPYQPNQTFRIRMEVNLASHTYSVFVTPPAGGEQALATDFAFRTEQQNVSSLNRWVVGSANGALKVCGASISGGNNLPVADAGLPQTVTEGTLVTLNGSASSDSDGSIVSWQWRQTSGPPVFLVGDRNNPLWTFTAPQPLFSTVALEFQLTVADNLGATASDVVQITVEPAAPLNTAPTADAGADQGFSFLNPIFEGEPVVLDGSGSDPDAGDRVTSYSWTQVDATPYRVTFTRNDNFAEFIAPEVSADTTLTFQLTVTDTNGATGTDTVDVLVRNRALNLAPVADAGLDQTDVPAGTLVTLSGSATDPDGDAIVSYVWAEIPAATVVLVPTADPATVTFTAPSTAAALTFVLTVTDARGASGSDSVNVTVVEPAPPPPGPI